MGFFDTFASETACPSCGNHGARKLLWVIKCRNRSCVRFDGPLSAEVGNVYAPPARASAQTRPQVQHRGDYDPGSRRVDVRYTNHRGEHKTFVGDAGTLRRRGTFVSLCVAPTGRRIALRLDSIDNRADVEAQVRQRPEPGPIERQVLAYHARRRTTSERYREVRAKFPDWQP